MRTAWILTAVALSFPVIVRGQENSVQESRRFNYGLTLDFCSTTLFMHDIRIGDFTTGEYSSNSEIDINVGAFCKANFRRSYLQTGLSYYNSHSSADFQYQTPESDCENEEVFSVEAKYLQIPLLFGYEIISQGPYCLSVFAGPKVSFPIADSYESDFSYFKGSTIEEDIYSVNYKAAFGISISVNHMLLNFGYDMELASQTDGRITDSRATGLPEVVMKRRTGTLYFSFGFIF